MQLLGSYNSGLQGFTYEQLLALTKAAIAQGGYNGSSSFDTATIEQLIQQSQQFTLLPLPSAGQRSTDNSLNYPMSLLAARYNALTAEAQDYVTKTNTLISVLEKDTSLLDQLLQSTELQSWIEARPHLTGATHFSWDYGMGPGPTSSDISQKDPVNGVIYPTECQTASYLDVIDSSQYTGMSAPSSTVIVPAKNQQWTWDKMTAGEQSQTLYGPGWAELDLLENYPLLNFLPNPTVNVMLPNGGTIAGVFNISGTVAGGSIPIFVQTVFQPRRNQITVTPKNALVDGGFENGGGSWTVGGGWVVYNDAGAQDGFYDAVKFPLSAWSSFVGYVPGNKVSYLNREYVCLISNTDQLPDASGSTFWGPTGLLSSSVFQLRPMDKIYIEAWIKNINANGILNVVLTCMDHNGTILQPQVYMPGVSSADNWLKISDVLQAADNSSVAQARIDVFVYGHTFGEWKVDNFRVHTPQQLSLYNVNQDDAAVYIPQVSNSLVPDVVYISGTDFIIDDIGDVVFEGLDDGVPVTVRFTESFPAYQCSVNQTVWSPLVMLDPNRPYPDNTKNFYPVPITYDQSGNVLFPITDEEGFPTGLTMQIVGHTVPFQYLFQVTTQATPQYGATATLEVDLSDPAYINAMTVAPFSNYPVRLLQVDGQPFGSNTRQTLGLPNAIMDRPITLTFPTTLLKSVFLTFYQENYNLSTYQIQPPDSLRRQVLFAVQNNLPFNVRRTQYATPVYVTGAQYTFGLENLAGLANTPVLPGVFVAGPHTFVGCPELIRLDAQYVDEGSIPNFNVYLCWKAYNSSGVVLDQETTGILFFPETCRVFPFTNPSTMDSGNVDHVDIYLKFVFRNTETVLERYLLQVTNA